MHIARLLNSKLIDTDVQKRRQKVNRLIRLIAERWLKRDTDLCGTEPVDLDQATQQQGRCKINIKIFNIDTHPLVFKRYLPYM